MSRLGHRTLEKINTGVPGFDDVLSGGVPKLSINIIAGPPGSGKTIFVQQLIYVNTRPDRRALYLTTLSEPSLKMLHYLQKFSFFAAEKVGSQVMYLDIGEIIRERGLEDTIEIILHHVQEYQPAIVVIDSFKAIHDMTKDPIEVRKFSYDLSIRLTTWAVTAFFVGEYSQEDIEHEPIFAVADGIIRFHNDAQGLYNQRYVSILKLRGEEYFTGMHPFTISDAGLKVYPRIRTSDHVFDDTIDHGRISMGISDLDMMVAGGLPRGTATMVAGGAGTGKTLLGLHFIAAGFEKNEPGVIVTFQENPGQLYQIAKSFGWDLRSFQERGLLVHLYHSPVEIQPDIHARHIKDAVDQIGARRVLIDSIKDIEIATRHKVRFKDYIYALVNEFKVRGITTFLTNEISEIFGSFHLSEYGVSFIADNIILLRYVELASNVGRALNVLKVRGSQHSKEIRSFEITNNGIRIGGLVQAVTGVLTGTPMVVESLVLQHLPVRSRYILDTIKQAGGACTLAELVEICGLSSHDLSHELGELQQQGIVIVAQKDHGDIYKATV